MPLIKAEYELTIFATFLEDVKETSKISLQYV